MSIRTLLQLDEPTGRDLLTTLRSIAASLESLVDLKRRELNLVGGPVDSPPLPDADPGENVMYTDDGTDARREERARLLGRLHELENDPFTEHPGIDVPLFPESSRTPLSDPDPQRASRVAPDTFYG